MTWKIIFPLLILFARISSAQQNTYDSLEQALDKETVDEKKLEILFQFTKTVSDIDLEKTLEYAKQGVDLADKTNNKNWQPKFYELTGKVYSFRLQFDTALIFLDKALNGYISVKNTTGQANVLIKQAWIYRKKGEIEHSLKLDLQSLRLMEAEGDQTGISTAYNKISEDLTRQWRFKEALKYAVSSIEISQKTNVPSDLLFAYFAAGNVYIAMGNYKQSLEYYNKAFDLITVAAPAQTDLVSLKNNKGNAFKKLGRFKEALNEYQSSLSLAQKIKLPGGIAIAIANLGETNLLMGNYESALGYQLETVRLQEKNDDYSNLIENYKHVSEIYEHLGKYRESLEYQKKARALGDTLASDESDAAMSEMLTKYETEKKEATIASQKTKLAQQNLVQKLTIALIGLLALFLIFGYRSYRQRTKTNKLLAERNAENELLLKEIHHRVKNNLEVVSGLLALQSDQINDPKTKEAMQESQNRVQSIGIVHQKLYQGTNLGSVEMKDYFLNLSESILDTFGAEKRVTIECAMDKLDVDIDTAVPLGLIVNELLTNTLKYAFANNADGKVLIKLEKSYDGSMHLEVSDNGIGKSGVTQGTGFGAQLISLLTKQLGGSMREEIKNGTRIFIDFNSAVSLKP